MKTINYVIAVVKYITQIAHACIKGLEVVSKEWPTVNPFSSSNSGGDTVVSSVGEKKEVGSIQ